MNAPKVKPLVWIDLHGDGSLYETSNDHPLGYHAAINSRLSKGWWYFGHYSTLDAAKTAAQADYERRMMSVIDFATSEADALRAENERLRNGLAAIQVEISTAETFNPSIECIVRKLTDGDA